MLLPALAVRRRIQHQRLDMIHPMGKFRLRRLAFLEFIPQRPEPLFLVFGEKPEDTVCRRHFTRPLGLLAFLVVGIGIARVDLHQIMDQKHRHRL